MIDFQVSSPPFFPGAACNQEVMTGVPGASRASWILSPFETQALGTSLYREERGKRQWRREQGPQPAQVSSPRCVTGQVGHRYRSP